MELFLHLKRGRGRSWSHAELVTTLRGSDLIVSQSLEGLLAAGLIVLDEDGCARYQPAAPDLARLADETEDCYARKPDAVRRAIVAAASSGLTAFADAFRIRRT